MNLVFFGDSITSGENNNFKSYVEYIKTKYNVQSFGISGTTFGEYSPYPVDGYSLISTLMKNPIIYYPNMGDIIEQADMIFVEFGFNDATAVCMRLCPLETVVTNMIKCKDFIQQNNDKCKIVFLYGEGDFLDRVADNQIDYLRTDYLIEVWNELFDFSSDSWAYTYSQICSMGKMIFDDSISIFPENLNFDEDNLHPDDDGYRKIGNILTKYIKNN